MLLINDHSVAFAKFLGGLPRFSLFAKQGKIIMICVMVAHGMPELVENGPYISEVSCICIGNLS
jgi:hypothetical protein